MADDDGGTIHKLTRRLGDLSPDYRIEGGIFMGLEGVLFAMALFHAVRECRNRAQFAALYVFVHRMLICGTLLHIIELAVLLHSTYGPITGYVGTIASNFKQLPSVACLFYFIGVTFEVYQREFLPGKAATIAKAWRVLVIMLGGFMTAIVLSLILMFAIGRREYNVITTLWEGVCFLVTLFVVLFATCRLSQAANQRRASIVRRPSATDPGNPLIPLLRKVAVISLILIGCFVACVVGAYSVFAPDSVVIGGTDATIIYAPPPAYVYWDFFLLDVMYVTIHSVVTLLSWKSPRLKRPMEDSGKQSVAWDRKSSGSSKPRMPLSPLSLNTQHSQDGGSNNGASYNAESAMVSVSLNVNSDELPPLSPAGFNRDDSSSEYAG